MDRDPKHPLCGVYINLRFLASHSETAKKNLKEMQKLWDLKTIHEYS